MQVSPAKYMQIIAALQPDMYTAMADDVASSASRKRARASVTRTAQWLVNHPEFLLRSRGLIIARLSHLHPP